MDVTWKNILGLLENILPHHIIFCDAVEYFATSFNNIHVAKNTNYMPWHGMEYALRFFSCSLEKVRLLMFTRSPTSIVVILSIPTKLKWMNCMKMDSYVKILSLLKILSWSLKFCGKTCFHTHNNYWLAKFVAKLQLSMIK